jgi:hypothetical protein
MKRFLSLAVLIAAVASPAISADINQPSPNAGPPAQLTLPPGFEPPHDVPPDEPPLQCDLKASPDYVPGIDVKGREVAPADLSTSRQVEIDTQVYVETRPRNRRLPRTGVIVNLPDLGAPACVPLDEKLSQ